MVADARAEQGVSKVQSFLFALLGLGRGGQVLYVTLFVLAVPALMAYTLWLPRVRFSEADEHLFRAARHGDRGGIERALEEGASVTDASPVDGKTALFRADLEHKDVRPQGDAASLPQRSRDGTFDTPCSALASATTIERRLGLVSQ